MGGSLARAPFVPLVLALICGILLWQWDAPIWVIWALSAIAVLAALWRLRLTRLSRIQRQHNLIWWAVLPLIIAAGYLCMALHAPRPEIAAGDYWPYKYMSGTVEEASAGAGGDKLVVRVDTLISFRDEAVEIPSLRVMVNTSGSLISEGDIILLKARPEPLKKDGFDDGYKELMYARGIDYTCYVPTDEIIVTGHARGLRLTFAEWRDALQRQIEQLPLSRDARALMQAMFTGERDYLDAETRADFSAVGLAHILALSGLHIGIIMALLLWLLLPLNALGAVRWRYILAGVGIVLFAMMTGFGVSVMRATIMGCCYLLALCLERRRSGVNLLCAAAFLILMFTPRALFDVGFRLSFVTALAIILFAEALTPFATRRGHRWHQIFGWIVVPLVAYLAAWPLTAWYFHSLPLMSLPLNLIFVPLLPLYMFASLIYLAAFAVGVDLTWIGWGIDGFTRALMWASHLIASSPGSAMDIWVPEAMPWLYLIALGFLAYYLRTLQKVALWGAALFGCASIGSLFLLPTSMPPDCLEVQRTSTTCRVRIYRNGVSTDTTFIPESIRLYLLDGKTVAWVDSPVPTDSTARPVKCDLLLVGSGYRGTLDALSRHFSAALIAVHSSVSELNTARYANESDTLRNPVRFLRTDAPLRLSTK